MTDDPTTCPRCGQTHDPEKCTGHNSAGRPCGNRPIRGGTVCSTHGGSAPQVRAAAEARQTEAAADAEIRKLWPGLLGAAPVTDPVDVLARTTGVLEQMAETVGDRVNTLKGISGGEHLQLLRAEVVLLDRLLDKLLKASEAMARLGIAERHVQLEQERANVVTAAFLAALDAAGLLPDQRVVMVERFTAGLRPIVPGEVVA